MKQMLLARLMMWWESPSFFFRLVHFIWLHLFRFNTKIELFAVFDALRDSPWQCSKYLRCVNKVRSQYLYDSLIKIHLILGLWKERKNEKKKAVPINWANATVSKCFINKLCVFVHTQRWRWRDQVTCT